MFVKDYAKWHLPKGAKLRLGKGYINEITYSPDSSRLAVASSIGIWVYDAETGEELDLFTGHTVSGGSLSSAFNKIRARVSFRAESLPIEIRRMRDSRCSESRRTG